MHQMQMFDACVQIVQNHTVPMTGEFIPVADAAGRVLAEDAKAAIDVPPFARAMMDGFAVRHVDVTTSGAVLTVVGTIAAGAAPELRVSAGQAVRVMTGAPVPEGADTVVRFEWCDEPSPDTVKILRVPNHGESVQSRGDDGRAGTVLIRAGSRVAGVDVAILRTFGLTNVTVRKRPRVAIIVTGSELVSRPELPLAKGQIYGANDVLLSAALAEDGAQVISVDFVADDLAQLQKLISERALVSDYVITTGGVSAGDYDFVPVALANLKSQLAVEKVLMRPGSPFVCGKLGQATVFSLSGNPAANFVQFETLVRPVIRASLGLADTPFPSTGRLRHDIALKPIKHVRVLRATANVVDGQILVDASKSQSSGVISSFRDTNCLIRLDEDELGAGTVVPLRWFRPLQ